VLQDSGDATRAVHRVPGVSDSEEFDSEVTAQKTAAPGRRLALAVGSAVFVASSVAVALAISSANARGLQVRPTIQQKFEEHVDLNQCTADHQNCIQTRCCKDPGNRCFAKDRAWAVCKPSCTPGVDHSEAPELQTPWSCAWLRPQGQCSDYGQNCTATMCCQDASAKCYYKDPGWAECMPSCTPGMIRSEEPKKLQTPWSCVVAGSEGNLRLQPKVPLATSGSLGTSSDHNDQCVPKYHNCTERTCCPDEATGKPVHCYKRDDEWSECRGSCPVDSRWACSHKVATSAADSPDGSHHAAGSTGSPQVVIQGPLTPSIYCFSLMLPWGYEITLIRAQLAKRVGIFSCNSWNVISNETIALGQGPSGPLETEVMPGDLKCSFGGEFHTALNSKIFYRVWRKVAELGRYRLSEWTVKADPDAVLLPQRLRRHTAIRNSAQSIYLNNCYEGLHGPIEVLSQGGMRVFARDLEHCRRALEHEWMTYGEDVWLRRCFGLLGLSRVDDYSVLREKACKPFKDPIPCTANAVSFHPLKSTSKYFECLGEAMHVESQLAEG